jgi:uncharacterized membrane protein YeaQ/YmgE (transglycosylase-associated protein family)
VSLLLALLIGAGIGVIAGVVLLEDIDTIVLDIILGVAGSVLGMAIYYFLLAGTGDNGLFSVPAILSSTIGAGILVTILHGRHVWRSGSFGQQNRRSH